MTDEEFIVEIGNGATKERRRNVQKPAEKILTEEERIMKEFEEPVKQTVYESTELPDHTPVKEQSREYTTPTQRQREGTDAAIAQPRIIEAKHSLESRVATFTRVELIGSGGICDVYEVKQTGSDARYALKTIGKKTLDRLRSANPEALIAATQLLRREAEVIQRQSATDSDKFPSFAFVIDNEIGLPEILTEYVPHSLDEKISEGLETGTAIKYFLNIARGVSVLNSQGVVHRDIKPSNIRITDGDLAKIVDLNLNCQYREDTEHATLVNSLMTSLGAANGGLVGTPRYMAPEQWEGKADVRTDVFQLTALLYEMIAGVKPAGAFKKLGSLRGELARLDEIIQKGLAQHPKDRYENVEALIDDVTEKTRDEEDASVFAPRTIQRRKLFDDLIRVYNFGNSDYPGAKKPWFMRWRTHALDYSSFLTAGTAARVTATRNILKAIENSFREPVNIFGIPQRDLEQVLSFQSVPFKNAPQTVPEEEEMYNNKGSNGNYVRGEPIHRTKFDLVVAQEKIGEIEYILPQVERIPQSGCYADVHQFTRGRIRVGILGASIRNEEQYRILQAELKKVRRN